MGVFVADKNGHTDGSMHRLLQMVECKLPIVLMSRTGGFTFNEALRRLDRWVLVEVSELGWDWDITESHTWGGNTDRFPQYQSEEYKKFDEWVAQNPPVFTLQRELLKKDVTDNRKPIDYPMWYQVPPPVSKEEFESRPFELINYWGRSHERRLLFHSAIWRYATICGLSICDNLHYAKSFIENESGKKWATFHIAHYNRIPMEELIHFIISAKIGVSLRGAGYKCFRTTEVAAFAVLCMHNDELAYSFMWEHGSNCIKMPFGTNKHCNEEIGAIEKALNRKDLYEIYVNGIENCRRYQADNYVRNYINRIFLD